jgi:hypothetical protein
MHKKFQLWLYYSWKKKQCLGSFNHVKTTLCADILRVKRITISHNMKISPILYNKQTNKQTNNHLINQSINQLINQSWSINQNEKKHKTLTFSTALTCGWGYFQYWGLWRRSQIMTDVADEDRGRGPWPMLLLRTNFAAHDQCCGWGPRSQAITNIVAEDQGHGPWPMLWLRTEVSGHDQCRDWGPRCEAMTNFVAYDEGRRPLPLSWLRTEVAGPDRCRDWGPRCKAQNNFVA